MSSDELAGSSQPSSGEFGWVPPSHVAQSAQSGDEDGERGMEFEKAKLCQPFSTASEMRRGWLSHRKGASSCGGGGGDWLWRWWKRRLLRAELPDL